MAAEVRKPWNVFANSYFHFVTIGYWSTNQSAEKAAKANQHQGKY